MNSVAPFLLSCFVVLCFVVKVLFWGALVTWVALILEGRTRVIIVDENGNMKETEE